MNTSFSNRYRNYLNSRTFAGGDDRLRGYPTNFFFGNDTVFYNLEFRSTSVEILKAQIGGVLFYDAGDVATDFNALRAKQSVGMTQHGWPLPGTPRDHRRAGREV